MSSIVEHLYGTIDGVAAGGFDLILADRFGDILLTLAAELRSRASPRARLSSSGILIG